MKNRLSCCGVFVAGFALAGLGAEARFDQTKSVPVAERLRIAIQELGQQFGARYPVEALLVKVAAAGEGAAALEALAHEALIVNNPLLADHPILFVTRKQYRPDHHNTETMFQTGEINTGSYRGGGAL